MKRLLGIFKFTLGVLFPLPFLKFVKKKKTCRLQSPEKVLINSSNFNLILILVNESYVLCNLTLHEIYKICLLFYYGCFVPVADSAHRETGQSAIFDSISSNGRKA